MTDIARQKTIQETITITGVGLHTGRKCKAIFKPAPVNTGIQFTRIDLPGNPVFPAHYSHVIEVIRGTTLGNGSENRVYTIEHLLSAFNGLEIDNVIIDLDDNEPPVLDGSAKTFTEAILNAGIVEQEEAKQFYTVDTPFTYEANSTSIRIEPHDTFEIQCEVDYNHPLLQKQEFHYTRQTDYLKEIAPARTFCFDYEIEGLKKKGLAKGGSLDNSIVIGPAGIYNPGDFLRFKDEFVRHKVLDLMGDLMLLGQPIQGRIIANRCGHGHNLNFIKKLLQERPISSSVSIG